MHSLRFDVSVLVGKCGNGISSSCYKLHLGDGKVNHDTCRVWLTFMPSFYEDLALTKSACAFNYAKPVNNGRVTVM